MVGGAENVALKVEIACHLDDATRFELLVEAIHAAPLGGLMRGTVESLSKLAKNGRDLPTAPATELRGPRLCDPIARFGRAEPLPDTRTRMEPAGPTPKKPVAKGTAAGGSSLSDHQDRRFNVGAVAALDEHGIE
jgi:hypothetical protein